MALHRALVADKARAVLALEADNVDAVGFLRMAEANGVAQAGRADPGISLGSGASATETTARPRPTPVEPDSFAGGRYEVRRFLGEGGKKRVFLAHDTLLDRDIAFSLIKTEELDQQGRERVARAAITRAPDRLVTRTSG